MYALAILLLGLVSVQGQMYSLDFKEGGQLYKEMITIDKQNQILVYDVPQHANRGAATYLKDFLNRLNVMRDSAVKTCYIWTMDKDEPTPDNVLKALNKANFKFPQNRYWVQNDKMLKIGKYDSTKVPTIIGQFCQNHKLIEVEIFASTADMEKSVKEKLLKKYGNGKTKRAVEIDEYQLCDDDAKYVEHVRKCYQAGRSDLLTLRCKILLNPHCSYTVSCKKLPNQNVFECPDPVHTMTQIHCCTPKCSLVGTQSPTVVTNPTNKSY